MDIKFCPDPTKLCVQIIRHSISRAHTSTNSHKAQLMFQIPYFFYRNASIKLKFLVVT